MPANAPGPYCTLAVTPAGNCPRCSVPQRHLTCIAWCSVTCIRSTGRSNTWRTSPMLASPCISSLLQCSHCPSGRCRTIWSGRCTCLSVVPLWPFCPPEAFALRPRSDLGLGLFSPSLDGGLLELLLLSASRPCSSSTLACSSLTCSTKVHSWRINSSLSFLL